MGPFTHVLHTDAIGGLVWRDTLPVIRIMKEQAPIRRFYLEADAAAFAMPDRIAHQLVDDLTQMGIL